MWYILTMNKDVIYIEPEDDITDIITKIENSKEKIVALVPPKKAGVFRSVVNIKLVSKVGATAEKTIVLVTTDPSIVKLAAATRIPVTKNLQTPPAIPTADMEIEETSEEEIVDESEAEAEKKEEEKEETEEAEDTEEEEAEKKDKKADKAAKKKKADKDGNPIISWIKAHKKLTIFGCIALVALIIFMIWAFVIAPAVTVTVGIKTENNNFSENVTFTTNAADENAADGKFYIQEKKVETVAEVSFEATGKKNKGEKAKGELQVYAYFPLNVRSSVQISEGTAFTISGLTFLAAESQTLTYNGDGKNQCANKDNSAGLVDYGCRINGTISVVASEPGAKYNIAASSTGWDTIARVFPYSDNAMTGGTDDIVTVVEQADIEKAKDQLKSSSEDEEKEKLFKGIGEDMMIIESSFNQDTSAATATPAAGEEVKDGVKPVLKATTTATVFAIDKNKVEEFISEKAKLGDDQKIYEINNPYIENFVKGDSGFAGRLKTSYAVGPKVTENDIVEMIKGKGIGDAQHDLKNINGVVSVSIDKSYPWVGSVPGNTNKITVNIELKDK